MHNKVVAVFAHFIYSSTFDACFVNGKKEMDANLH